MWDAAAGLYYYHARWYDAATGRFISQDPLSFAAGDVNLYRYGSNEPTNASDPTGLEMESNPGSLFGPGGPIQGPGGTIGISNDVTERMKEIADAEAAEAARLRRLLGVKPVRPDFFASREEWNRYYKEMEQWSNDELERNGLGALDPPADPNGGGGGLFGGGAGSSGFFGGGGIGDSPAGSGGFKPGPVPKDGQKSLFDPREERKPWFVFDLRDVYDPQGRLMEHEGTISIGEEGGCGFPRAPLPGGGTLWIKMTKGDPEPDKSSFGGIKWKF